MYSLQKTILRVGSALPSVTPTRERKSIMAGTCRDCRRSASARIANCAMRSPDSLMREMMMMMRPCEVQYLLEAAVSVILCHGIAHTSRA